MESGRRFDMVERLSTALLAFGVGVVPVQFAAATAGIPNDAVAAQTTEADAACLRLLALGYEALEAENPQSAAEHYENAISAATTPELKFQALLGSGSAYTALNRLDQARMAFEAALEISPEHAGAWYSLASVQIAEGQTDEAIAALDRACAAEPGFVPALYDRCVLLASDGRNALAAASCAEAVDRDPSHAAAWLGLAVAQFQLAEYETALATFSKVLELEPENPRAIYGLGLSYLYSGDAEAATAEYVRLRSLDAELARDLYLRILE
jgi:tetratricopeptide (TPR) repeat protein